jgi:hypothetical protein
MLPSPGCNEGKLFRTEDLSGTTPAAPASEDRRSPNAKRIRPTAVRWPS